MELREYMRILLQSWLLVVSLTLVGVLAAGAMSMIVTARYEATSQLYVSVRHDEADTASDLVQGATFAQQSVNSYIDLATSALVLDNVIEELDLDTTSTSLRHSLSVTSPENTVLISITATDENPGEASALANTTGEVFSRVVENEIEVADANGVSPIQVRMIQPASVPEAPVSPNIPINIAVGLLLGLAAGIGIALLRSVLDTRIRSIRDIEQLTDAPILGRIPVDPEVATRPLIVHSDGMSPRAESFRSLRTNLQFIGAAGSQRVVVVTSAMPSEGKTNTVTNLAIALADNGASVVLVDADLRNPTVAEVMGIEGGVGLTDVLIGRADLSEVLQHWGRRKLHVLPSGAIPPNPSELLGSAAMEALLGRLGSQVDYVLIDSPPLLPVTDAAVVSKYATGTVLVVTPENTKRPQFSAALNALRTIDSRLLGVVATKMPAKGADRALYPHYRYERAHTGQAPDHLDPDAAESAIDLGDAVHAPRIESSASTMGVQDSRWRIGS